MTSRAGRDRGDRYVIIATLGHDMVLVADGERRGVHRPKKKNVKHLVVHGVVPQLAAKLARGEMPADEEIRQVVAQAGGERPPAQAARTGS
ncbi:MAG: KOW domain-containing RNA-binding protein [Armatimonadota bacterium]|nr:KOW domain-containing RNA-binding protein [Armatimonadota bacterium]MDR7464131.1 KOW domain-containing RNA-binding protein [Armatimonadota bacterium]MDR7470422.1 KOW domain-containing RNA-binding protein [Armatimonadota bacterium]MDR7473504.1 KOW domain-containing RNA-binding protein [Armatimonadota bacterium]MDR7540139.1 KOW domain-containing RNA-binding protein [Armatimonadota bacterium]